MINGSSAKSGVQPIYSPVFCGVSDNTETHSKYIECFVCLFVYLFLFFIFLCVCDFFLLFFLHQNQYSLLGWDSPKNRTRYTYTVNIAYIQMGLIKYQNGGDTIYVAPNIT